MLVVDYLLQQLLHRTTVLVCFYYLIFQLRQKLNVDVMVEK